jgi:hypothetical protein
VVVVLLLPALPMACHLQGQALPPLLPLPLFCVSLVVAHVVPTPRRHPLRSLLL